MAEKEYIEREAIEKAFAEEIRTNYLDDYAKGFQAALLAVMSIHTADVSPVRHGRWLYEVHKENVNFRWNVTVKCSECYDNRKEIWGGFFPNVPDCIARDVALQNAKQIKLDNYCPNCGVKIDKED